MDLNVRTIVTIVLVIGVITILWWAINIAVKFFIPLAIIAAGVFVYYKYFRKA